MNNSQKHQRNIVLSLVVAAGLVVSASTSSSFAGNFANNHPRRAEVLHRDNNINGRLNKDYGKLDGHYGQLMHRDQQIRNQQQRDAHANGGYITRGQKQQLNKEENHLNRKIKADS